MKLNDYLSPEELKRLASALLVVLGFISIAAFFGFTVVPGLRYQAHTTSDAVVVAVQGETGWLDPTDYPVMAREVIPPIDPRTVMTPNPALLARGKALFAHMLDMYWLIFPVVNSFPGYGKSPCFSWPELSFALFFLGGILLWVRGAMEKGEDMPVGDPFLREGLEFRL